MTRRFTSPTAALAFVGRLLFILTAWCFGTAALAAVNPEDLLPPEQAFVPTVEVSDQGVAVRFDIAEGYYLYQSKIAAETEPAGLLGSAQASAGKEKEDEFFGKQSVYYRSGEVRWPYTGSAPAQYRLTLSYQGCADVGVCYPPVETAFEVSGSGRYEPQDATGDSGLFLKKATGTVQSGTPAVPASTVPAEHSAFKLSRDTLWFNLSAFFLAGLALSFTACMYPLLPIVSGIIIGDKSSSKRRAFLLSLIYVQGLALTYTLVGVLAGLTGALLTVWLQQAWVVLAAAGLMVLLSLSMFGLFNLQLPAALQSYFQNQSNRLSGGKAASVFVMGMLSALIVGPCIAPPLAFALGYIGQTGDAALGGLALYTLAIGTGVPLILIGTFGGHILPRAGAWMNGIKYAFGTILLAVAVYLATPFMPYGLTAALYTLLLLLPALYLLWRAPRFSGSLKPAAGLLAAALVMGSLWFGWQSIHGGTTRLHAFLTLHPPLEGSLPGQKFTDTAALKQTIAEHFRRSPDQPVLLDFYADWCVSCKEMEAKTFSRADVQAAVPLTRMVQIDVTANSPEHQALLKEYGLYGPPGLFVLHADGRRSDALLGYAAADEFIQWYHQRAR